MWGYGHTTSHASYLETYMVLLSCTCTCDSWVKKCIFQSRDYYLDSVTMLMWLMEPLIVTDKIYKRKSRCTRSCLMPTSQAYPSESWLFLDFSSSLTEARCAELEKMPVWPPPPHPLLSRLPQLGLRPLGCFWKMTHRTPVSNSQLRDGIHLPRSEIKLVTSLHPVYLSLLVKRKMSWCCWGYSIIQQFPKFTVKWIL